MSVDKAKAYYTGKGVQKRLNCAQAIIGAYEERFSLDSSLIGLFAAYGGGKAPDGECGAYHAAKAILKDKHAHKMEECRADFVSHAGSTKCKEIKSLKKLPCIGCVEKIAVFIDKIRD